ncbi:DMT family transporter [Rhodanobacter sp. MP7CTX1]|jgi:drug/metabolite transporter (DMT)-like permease|uniref:DMT family transporter n=1 Tax=Rhodanobacter sp. MP7CTX1 TaxID=2723084 RepID=UPI00160AC72F|nr:DMT family transporter [Rhodanobacter sp. MP7CTX1]MBB6189471.1 S-adenosylmethionine uptake transporter [Rhodanobacter sp. MP7CTX1]
MFKGVLLGFMAFAAYACSDAFVKLLRGSLPAYEAVFFGAALGLTALPFIRHGGARWHEVVIARRPGLWLVRAAASAIGSTAAVIAFTALPMAEAFALIFLLPIFVTILSVILLKEHVGWRRWSAVVAGFVGVLVVLRPGFRALGIGHLAATVCALTGAISIIALRVSVPHEKRITLYGAGVIGPLLVTSILMLSNFVWPSMHQWLLLLGYGLLAALASVLLMLATQRSPANHVAPTQYSQMLWAVLFGYVLFHDRLDWPMLLGIAIILGAGLFTLVREEKVTPWWRRARLV